MPVERLNDAYFQAIKTIESQTPRKKKLSKAVFDVGDVAQYYYAEFVTSQSQHQAAPSPAQMVNERSDHLQEILNQINNRLNNAISREQHMTLVIL